jgi:hypothetical protein
MRADEIRPHDAVAVEEDAVGAARRQNRTVTDFRRAEPTILVPDVVEAAADLPLPSIDHRGGGRSRTVIGHDNLENPVGLAPKRAQHRFERILAVIGGDDDGNQLGHWRPLDCQALADVAHRDKPLGRARSPMLTCHRS